MTPRRHGARADELVELQTGARSALAPAHLMLFSCGDPRRFDPRVLIAVALDGDRVARDAPERLLGTGDGLVWTEVWSHSITHARSSGPLPIIIPILMHARALCTGVGSYRYALGNLRAMMSVTCTYM